MLACTGHAAIQSVSDPFQIDGTIVPHVSHKYLGQVAAASNCFLFAWLDLREGYQPRVYGARIELDGTTSNMVGTRLSGALQERFPERELDLASDGRGFLAVWHSVISTNAGIRASLIDNNGVPAIDELIMSTNANARTVQVAACAGGYFVVWLEPKGFNQILRGARVASSGHVLDRGGFAITDVAWSDSPIKVAAYNNTVLIGYSLNERNALAVTVHLGDSVRVDRPFFIASGLIEATAWWHGKFLVVCSQTQALYQDTLRGFFVDLSGTVSPAPLDYSEAAEQSSIWHVTLVAGATGGVLGWRSQWAASVRPSEWRSVALNSNAAVVASSPFPSFETASMWNYYPHWWPLEIAVAGETLFLHKDALSYFVRTAEGTLVTNRTFIKGTPNQSNAAIASNGRDYLVVWADTRWVTNWFLFGRRFRSSGDPLDAVSFQLDPHPVHIRNSRFSHEDWQGRPALASCRGDYMLLMFTGYHHIYGKRILGNGAIEDGYLEITQTATASQPDIAAGRHGYLAAWSSYSNERAGDIQARFIAPDGTVGPLFLLEDTETDAVDPLVAAVGDDFLIVWKQRSQMRQVLNAALVPRTGAIRHFANINFPLGRSSALAAGANSYIWLTTRSRIYGQEELFISTLRRSGSGVDGFTIATNFEQTFALPTIAARGTRALAVWHEYHWPTSDIIIAEVTADRAVFPRSIGVIDASEAAGFTQVAIARATSMLVTESHGPSGRQTLSGRVIRHSHNPVGE